MKYRKERFVTILFLSLPSPSNTAFKTPESYVTKSLAIVIKVST